MARGSTTFASTATRTATTSFDPTFSPDGKYIAMQTGVDGGSWGIYGFNVNDGSLVAQYANTDRTQAGPGLDYLPKNLDWRPDGNSILFGFDDSRPGSACAPLGEEGRLH